VVDNSASIEQDDQVVVFEQDSVGKILSSGKLCPPAQPESLLSGQSSSSSSPKVALLSSLANSDLQPESVVAGSFVNSPKNPSRSRKLAIVSLFSLKLLLVVGLFLRRDVGKIRLNWIGSAARWIKHLVFFSKFAS